MINNFYTFLLSMVLVNAFSLIKSVETPIESQQSAIAIAAPSNKRGSKLLLQALIARNWQAVVEILEVDPSIIYNAQTYMHKTTKFPALESAYVTYLLQGLASLVSSLQAVPTPWNQGFKVWLAHACNTLARRHEASLNASY